MSAVYAKPEAYTVVAFYADSGQLAIETVKASGADEALDKAHCEHCHDPHFMVAAVFCGDHLSLADDAFNGQLPLEYLREETETCHDEDDELLDAKEV